jgi:hypothetical protein
METLQVIGRYWVWALFGLWMMAYAIVYAPGFGWLSWLPDYAFVVLALPGIVLVVLPSSASAKGLKMRLGLVAVPLLWMLFSVARYDYRPWSSREVSIPANVLRVAFLNASHPTPEESRLAAKVLLAQDAEVVVVTDPGGLHGDLESLVEGSRVAGTFRVSVVTALPIAAFGMVYSSEWIHAVKVVVVLPNGSEFRILVVDLPSSGDRAVVVGSLAGLLKGEQAGRWDLVVGDFNMTSRHREFRRSMQPYENVFEEEGVGWGATWPGRFPLLRIDHGFVSDPESLRRAETFDAGVDHRGLLMTFEVE